MGVFLKTPTKITKVFYKTQEDLLNNCILGLEVLHNENIFLIFVRDGVVNPMQTYEDFFEVVAYGKYFLIQKEYAINIEDYGNFQWENTKEIFQRELEEENFYLLKDKVPLPVYWALKGMIFDENNI